MELAQLLQRWATLEPERVVYYPPVDGETCHARITLCTREHTITQHHNGMIAEHLALLEYAIREAIIARGWDWKIESVTTGFYATVLRTAYDSVGIYEQQPAIALLIAYIEALEAQHG